MKKSKEFCRTIRKTYNKYLFKEFYKLDIKNINPTFKFNQIINDNIFAITKNIYPLPHITDNGHVC